MDEQDYKNLIAVYQNKLFDFMNQNIALEARELKYRQTIDILNKKITDLEDSQEKTKRTSSKSSSNEFQ